jgi:hypothetical protein
VYKVVTLQPHCTSQLSYQLPSSTISLHLKPSCLHTSAKPKLRSHMKMLPDAHITDEEDFVAWGRQFVDAAISHV